MRCYANSSTRPGLISSFKGSWDGAHVYQVRASESHTPLNSPHFGSSELGHRSRWFSKSFSKCFLALKNVYPYQKKIPQNPKNYARARVCTMAAQQASPHGDQLCAAAVYGRGRTVAAPLGAFWNSPCRRRDPSPGPPWQQLMETWAPGQVTRPTHLCLGLGGDPGERVPSPLYGGHAANVDPGGAGGLWEGLVSERGGKQTFWGEQSLGPTAGRKRSLLPSVSSEGRSTSSSLSSTAGSWEGMTESCGKMGVTNRPAGATV